MRLRPADIDSQRMMIRIVHGKRARDRYTLLSPRLLEELRNYCRVYRPRTWLVPGRTPERPFNDDKARTVFNRAKAQAGIRKGGSIHVLRHCFATHLLEDGVNVRVIQALLGHARLDTTAFYTKVATRTMRAVTSPLDRLTASTPRESPPG